jgi:hypothetical protein
MKYLIGAVFFYAYIALCLYVMGKLAGAIWISGYGYFFLYFGRI